MILQTFRALANSGEIEVDWLVEGLLTAGGWTYLVGEAGSGKSMLCIQLCDALQRGVPFLNMLTKQRNCLYIQTDTGRAEWKVQVQRLAGDSFAWTMHALEALFLDVPSEVELIRNIVWGNYPEDSPIYKVCKGMPFNFVVFDVLNKMTAKDLNIKPSFNHVVNTLEYICSNGLKDELKYDIPFILIHHPSGSIKRGVNAGSGSKAFGGVCTNMLTLANSLLVLEKSKLIAKREFMLERELNGAWKLANDSLDEDTLNKLLGL